MVKKLSEVVTAQEQLTSWRRRNCNHKIRCIFNSRLGTVVFLSFVSEPLEICSPRSQRCPEVSSSKRTGSATLVLSSSQRWEIAFFRIEKRWWTVQLTNPKSLLWNGDKLVASNPQKETNGWWRINWCSAGIWCWVEKGNAVCHRQADWGNIWQISTRSLCKQILPFLHRLLKSAWW